MISDCGKGQFHVEEQAHRGADDRGAEAVRGGAQSGRCGAGGGRVKAHHLCVESKVRRDGCERGTRSEAVTGREHEVEKAGGGSQSRQRDAESGHRKKRVGLVNQRADADWLRAECAASERRGCGLMGIAVSSYRYQTTRCDDELRTRLVELAREKPRFGYRRLHVLLFRAGEAVNHKRVHRVYREAGLSLRRKRRKHCVRVGQPLLARTAANQEWALDFVHDAVECGRAIRVLSVVDAYTRECLARFPLSHSSGDYCGSQSSTNLSYHPVNGNGGQVTGFQGGFAVALLAGCNNDVQVSRHCSWHPLLFFARIRSSVTVGNIGGRLPGAFLLVLMMLDQLTKTFDGISIEL